MQGRYGHPRIGSLWHNTAALGWNVFKETGFAACGFSLALFSLKRDIGREFARFRVGNRGHEATMFSKLHNCAAFQVAYSRPKSTTAIRSPVTFRAFLFRDVGNAIKVTLAREVFRI